ncbi:hypothetical protein [Paenibacillus polymyxa]|uniref:hypothetical protein n=1 Tax=Paenibacillus polymyxa TaxID=1406 RepID=UPI002AB3F3FB|nr:hypothetical protein [Paenibacillus polymyxa]MDY8025507.1 hypothetical protein [Paenibacillus polymyxa]
MAVITPNKSIHLGPSGPRSLYQRGTSAVTDDIGCYHEIKYLRGGWPEAENSQKNENTQSGFPDCVFSFLSVAFIGFGIRGEVP